MIPKLVDTLPRLVDAINYMHNELIMNLNTSDIEELKIKSLYEEKMKKFKRKQIKKRKHTSKEIKEDTENKEEIIKLMNELFKVLINHHTKTIKEFNFIISNIIKDWDNLEEANIKNSIITENIKHKNQKSIRSKELDNKYNKSFYYRKYKSLSL